MCRAVFYARTNTHPQGKGYHPGDCVQVFEDGVELGLDVEPETSPEDSPFIVIEVPGVPRADVIYLQVEHKTDTYIQNDPDLEEFGEELRDRIDKRRYILDITRLPPQAKAEWGMAHGQGRTHRSPIQLPDRVALETALNDKRTGQPVVIAQLPRGKKE